MSVLSDQQNPAPELLPPRRPLADWLRSLHFYLLAPGFWWDTLHGAHCTAPAALWVLYWTQRFTLYSEKYHTENFNEPTKGGKERDRKGSCLSIYWSWWCIHENTITIAQQLKRGGEYVAQMRAETHMPVKVRPSGEVVPTKERPCGVSIAGQVRMFSGIHTRQQPTVVFDPWWSEKTAYYTLNTASCTLPSVHCKVDTKYCTLRITK